MAPVPTVTDTSSKTGVDVPPSVNAREIEAETRPPANSHMVTWPTPSDTNGSD